MIIGCKRMSGFVQVAAVCASCLAMAARPAAQATGCESDAAATLQQAARAADNAELDAAARALREALVAHPACGELATASWAWHAWQAAERAGAAGGSAEALAEVRAALDVLEPGGKAVGPGNALAAALAHAALAAAQQEREEMRVWLEHAAGLSQRLADGQRPWPLVPAVAEGELWLVLSDYELAAAAFTRAIDGAGETAIALRGLARARARGGDTAGACGPFSRVVALLPADLAEGAAATEAKAFLRLCK